jgi:hypothetical protein
VMRTACPVFRTRSITERQVALNSETWMETMESNVTWSVTIVIIELNPVRRSTCRRNWPWPGARRGRNGLLRTLRVYPLAEADLQDAASWYSPSTTDSSTSRTKRGSISPSTFARVPLAVTLVAVRNRWLGAASSRRHRHFLPALAFLGDLRDLLPRGDRVTKPATQGQ